jgi:hypothetical protein
MILLIELVKSFLLLEKNRIRTYLCSCQGLCFDTYLICQKSLTKITKHEKAGGNGDDFSESESSIRLSLLWRKWFPTKPTRNTNKNALWSCGFVEYTSAYA